MNPDTTNCNTFQLSPTTWKDWAWVGGIALVVFIIDHICKYWAATVLQYRPPMEIIPGVFYFGYGENTGIAFGLFQDHGGWLNFVVPAAFALLLYLIFTQFAEHKLDWWYKLIFGFLIGGAVGNIVDRLLFGYVVDFIDVFIGTYHWPTFNIADSALTVGQILLIGKLFIWNKPDEPATKPVITDSSEDTSS